MAALGFARLTDSCKRVKAAGCGEAEAPAFNIAPEAVLVEGGEPLRGQGNAWEVFKANPDGSAGEHVSTDYDQWQGTLEPGDYEHGPPLIRPESWVRVLDLRGDLVAMGTPGSEGRSLHPRIVLM